jgi:hypothetical protein
MRVDCKHENRVSTRDVPILSLPALKFERVYQESGVRKLM